MFKREILRLIDGLRPRPAPAEDKMVGCVITTEGVCPKDEEKGQIGGSHVIWDAEDNGDARSTAQDRLGLTGNPAVCYRPRRSSVSSEECRIK